MKHPSKHGIQDLATAVDLDFEEGKEYWNTYKLSDGTNLKIKLVLSGVKRLKKFNPDGSPIYVIRSVNVVRALNISEELRQKPKPSTTPAV